jgi:hypothetical protein
VAQALRAHAAHVRVLDLLDGDRAPPARRDARQLQLLAEDRSQLVQRDLDLQHVLARQEARLAAERRAEVPLALADPSHLARAEAEAGDLDLRQRDRDEVPPLAADELALRHVLPEVLLDRAAHDLLEPLHVAVDLPEHGDHEERHLPRFESRAAPGA